MRKIIHIIWREYISRVRTKSFLLTTFGAPLLFLLIPLISIFIAKSSNESVRLVAVNDQSGLFSEVVFADKEDGSLYFKKIEEDIPTDSLLNKYDGVLVIPPDFNLKNVARSPLTFVSKKRIGIVAREFINETIRKTVLKLQFEKLNLQSQEIDLESEAVINYERPNETDDKDAFVTIAYVIGFAIGFMMYIVITLYGTTIMRGVMEEKTNRIMEVLISSVKPVQLMLGKVIGVGAVGLTQFALWGFILFIGYLFIIPIIALSGIDPNTIAATTNTSSPAIDSSEIQRVIQSLQNISFISIGLWGCVYFLLGFFLYGTLFAAVGAVGNDETNAQSLTLPVMLPIIISFMMLQGALNDPDGKLAFWGSIIPFTSPIIMPSLLAFNPPFWQILLSIALLITTFIVMVYFAGKIYRTGVLMYGKKITWQEMLKWIIQ